MSNTIVDKIIDSIQDAVKIPHTETVNGQTVTTYTPIAVYYHDDPTLNVITSSMEFPCVLFQLLNTGRLDRSTPVAGEIVTAAVFFVEPADEWDDDAVANEGIIQRCKERALTWVASLNTTMFAAVSEIRTSRVYDRFDDILTGFGLTLDLQELDGLCIGNT